MSAPVCIWMPVARRHSSRTLGHMSTNPSEVAMAFVSKSGMDCSKLAVGYVREYDWGWSVHINSAEYWATKDPHKMLVGFSPVFVSRTFQCRVFPSYMPYEKMCSEFSKSCLA